jgi:hypothetical protein
VVEVEVQNDAVAVDGDRGDVVALVVLVEMRPHREVLLIPRVPSGAAILVAVPVLVHQAH